MVLHHLAQTLGDTSRDLDLRDRASLRAVGRPSLLSRPASAHPGSSGRAIVDLEWLKTHLRASRPGAVAVMAANNETGVLQPWRECSCSLPASTRCRFSVMPRSGSEKSPLKALANANMSARVRTNSAVREAWDFSRLRAADDYTHSLLGGGQEAGRRAGTENVAGVLSMIAALETS